MKDQNIMTTQTPNTNTPAIQTPTIIQSITNPLNNQTHTFQNNNLTSTSAEQLKSPTSILINLPLFQIYFLNSNPNIHYLHIPNLTNFFTYTNTYFISPKFNKLSTQSLISKTLTKIRSIYQTNPQSTNLLPTIQHSIQYFYSNQSILLHILLNHNTTPINYIFTSYQNQKNKSTTIQTNTNISSLINQITLPS